MNSFTKTLSLAVLSASASFAIAPAAQAQVAGIGTADEIAVIMGSAAFKNGFQQINTTYGASLSTIDARGNESQQLQQQLVTQFDANKDGQIGPDEEQKMQASKSPLIAQVQAKQEEMQNLEAPIRAAQIFVIDTLDKNYLQALKDVTTAKKVNIVLSPDAVVWVASPDALNLNQALTTRLDQLTPTINTVPPEPFNTSRRVIAIYEQVQQVQQARLMAAIRQAQAQQAQQQQQGAQPAAPAGGAKPAPAPGPAPQPDDGR
jgi:Skp family chaperone for outer membrane proteins